MDISPLRDEFDPLKSLAEDVNHCREQIESIRDFLEDGTDLPQMSTNDVGLLTNDLRNIIKTIKTLQNTQNIASFLVSADGIRQGIADALQCLYVASDILQMPGSIRQRAKFYRKLRQCVIALSSTLELFVIDNKQNNS